MKRIITIIFSVLLAMTALAQRELGLDEITKSIGGYNWKRKIHEKGTYVIFRHTILYDRSFRNMKGITDFNNDRIAQGRDTLNADTLKAKIDHEEMVYKETFARVRQMLDSLMEASEESYHFENHNRGVDSINYSICLESNKSRKINKDDWDFPDTTETITLNMRSKDTEIERILRKALWNEGIRYRKHYDKLPGKPDIAITKYRLAIFCDGEFFHGKDWAKLQLKLKDSNNSEYWIKKISRNIERDLEVEREIRAEDWTVIRFWGKDIKSNTEDCIAVIKEAIHEYMFREVDM